LIRLLTPIIFFLVIISFECRSIIVSGFRYGVWNLSNFTTKELATKNYNYLGALYPYIATIQLVVLWASVRLSD